MKIIDGHRLPTVTKYSIKGFFGDYRFLSNFHMCQVRVLGITYPSSEHAYMAMKTTNKQDRRGLRDIKTAIAARAAGRGIRLRDDWEDLKLVAMRLVIQAKFTQNKDLGKLLLETGSKYLEETNNWSDVFWGANVDGEGQNHLGKILMSVRLELSL
jgi:ribA/ribD-fused uncharacterized protein